MLRKKFKKIIALILTALTLFSVCSLAVSAAAETKKAYPVIYITGYGTPLFVDKNNYGSDKIYPTGVDVGERVKEALIPCLIELGIGSITDNYNKYCDELYNAVAPIYDDLRLNPDGTVKDNSGRKHNLNNIRLDSNRFTGGELYLWYDWRLSPTTLAEDVHALVEKLAAKHGKVNIIGRCFGANILSAYLDKYVANGGNDADKIDKAVYFIPSTEGIGLIGSLFSGKIDISAENITVFIDELVKYMDIIEDATIKDFIQIVLSVFEQASMLNVAADTLQEIIDNIKGNLIPRLVRDTYGSFPSFWSMVPDEYLSDALEFVYNTDELKETYAGTIKLIEEYRTIQQNSRKQIADLSDEIDFYVISKYNLPSVPIFGETNPCSDAVAETELTSFGATTADFGTTLGQSYIAKMDEADKKFLSADEKIDASTCLLPETTWFLKNSYHDHFTDAHHDLINRILSTDGMTVFTEEEYPQFLDCMITDESFTPVTTKDSDRLSINSDKGKFVFLFNFVEFVINIFFKVIEKFSHSNKIV